MKVHVDEPEWQRARDETAKSGEALAPTLRRYVDHQIQKQLK